MFVYWLYSIYVSFVPSPFSGSRSIEFTRFPCASLRDLELWPYDLDKLISSYPDRYSYRCVKFGEYCCVEWPVDCRAETIGVDLAGLLKGRMARAPKVGRCRVGWGMERGVSSPADYGVWGALWAPSWQRGPGQSPAGRRRILAYFEGHRTLIFVPLWRNLRGTICLSGQFALASPTPNSGELVPPVPPWSTPMAGTDK